MPVRAQLQSLQSADLYDLRGDTPLDPDDFVMSLQAIIGMEGSEDGEIFNFMVCTPRWLMRSVSERKVVFARHYLIVETYSYSVIHSAVESLCNRTWGETWHDIALKLTRYGLWEFEDYQPYRDPD